MTDYSKMSDFEINKAVAEELFKDRLSLIVKMDVPSRPAVTVFADIGNGEIVSITCADYCNNPADAWPVMWRNNISLIYIGESFWAATNEAKKYIKGGANVSAIGVMPLRAAMIVFLMMKDAEK